jgi:carboxymethylenebutenolidase
MLDLQPQASASGLAIVIGMPANGLSSFTRGVAQRLAGLGHRVLIPDYYRGAGPADTAAADALDGPHALPELGRLMDSLDFPRAAHDLIAAARYARADPDVRAVAVWGYCTGGTVAALAGCLGAGVVDRLVLFYPSQMEFPVTSALRPQSPAELLWALRCPTLLLVGDSDRMWPGELIARFGSALDRTATDHQVVVYPGAGHAFADHWSDGRTDSYDADADSDAWRRAVAFVGEGVRT